MFKKFSLYLAFFETATLGDKPKQSLQSHQLSWGLKIDFSQISKNQI